MDARPRMEEVLDRYDAMQRDMVDALDAELPGLTWQADPADRITWAGCDGAQRGDTGQQVAFVLLSASGTYDPASWHRSAEIVEEVGRGYGFDQVTTVLDRSDDLEIVGEDQYGARYRYGLAVNTILQVSTGCHRWETPPTEGYERPSPLADRPVG